MMDEIEQALDPNTPPETLARLASLHPEVVAGNPALPLLILADPTWLQRLPTATVGRLLASAALPSAVVHALALHPSRLIRDAAARHVSIVGEADENWEAAVWDHFARQRTPSKELLFPFFDQGKIPEPLLERFAACDDAELRAKVVKTAPNLPIVGLLQRACGSPSLHKIVAPDPSLTLSELTQLARHSGRFARRCALAQPHLPPALLAELAALPDVFVQVQVARHANTSAETRTALAQRGNAALELALERKDRVVYSAPTPKVPEKPACAKPAARRAASRFLQTNVPRPPQYQPPRGLLQHIGYRLSRGDLEFTPPSFSKQEEAIYQALPPEVRLALARRHDLPLSVRKLCAQDESAAVRRATRINPTTPSALRRALELPGTHRKKPAPQLELNRALWQRGLLRFVALYAHPVLPRAESLVLSSHWEDRLAAALHPSLKKSYLATLENDGHQWVRAAARRRLQ